VEQVAYDVCSGQIAKMSSATTTHLTTLQKEIYRFVFIIAGLAILVAILVVILWAAWYVITA
jgi:sodium/potassium-transporting ATPase subunit alpha